MTEAYEGVFEGYAAGTEEPDLRGVPLPGGARIAVRFQIALEDWESPPMLRSPDGSREVVDYRVVSARNYGVRTGFHRLLEVMDETGCVADVGTTGVCGDRWPELVAELVQRGHEVVAHGYSQGEQSAFMDEDEDFRTVERTVTALEKASGYRPVGWVSCGARRGRFTVKNLLRMGLEYIDDFREADVPFVVGRIGARRLIAMPRTDQTDNYALHNLGHSPGNYVDYFKRTFDRLYKEAPRHPGRVVTAVAHSTVVGHPWGADAVAECCDYTRAHDDVWQTTSRSIAEHYLASLAG